MSQVEQTTVEQTTHKQGASGGDGRKRAFHSSSELEPGKDLVEYLKQYAREKPEVVALSCLGVGFVLGWKLKPW